MNKKLIIVFIIACIIISGVYFFTHLYTSIKTENTVVIVNNLNGEERIITHLGKEIYNKTKLKEKQNLIKKVHISSPYRNTEKCIGDHSFFITIDNNSGKVIKLIKFKTGIKIVGYADTYEYTRNETILHLELNSGYKQDICYNIDPNNWSYGTGFDENLLKKVKKAEGYIFDTDILFKE